MDQDTIKEIKRFNRKNHVFILNMIFVVFIILLFFYHFLILGTNDKGVILHIESNDSITSVAHNLKDKKIIRSEFIFKSILVLFRRDQKIQDGDYLFSERPNIISVAYQISFAKHNINPIKITIREGLSNKEIASILSKKIPNFDEYLFIEKAKDKEGYLFPDTYFFYPFNSIDEIIEVMYSNFSKKVLFSGGISNTNKSLNDIITMASIIEKEASGKDDAFIISGVLWKRLNNSMPLQVDVSPITYKQRGLPVSPICNPGILSIKASLSPQVSPYMYYLHDKNGIAHFAKTYAEHLNNINKYLRQ